MQHEYEVINELQIKVAQLQLKNSATRDFALEALKFASDILEDYTVLSVDPDLSFYVGMQSKVIASEYVSKLRDMLEKYKEVR